MRETLAIIGLGSMGLKHTAAAQAFGYAVVGFDPDPTRCRTAVDSGAAVASSRENALAQAHAAVIASPPPHHLDDLDATVAAGVPAIVEKPFADRTDGLAAVLDAAEVGGLTVAVAQNLRFHPAVVEAKALIESGAFGPVSAAIAVGASYLPEWRPGTDYRQNYAADPYSGGAVFDWIHEVDLLAHLLGPLAPCGAAAGHRRHLDIPSEEQAAMLFRHEDGPLSTVYASYTVRPQLRRTQLLGPNGRIEIDIPGRRLTVVDAAGETVRDEAFGGRHEDDYGRELEDFLDAVHEGRQPRCPGREALAILEAVLAARALAGLPCRQVMDVRSQGGGKT